MKFDDNPSSEIRVDPCGRTDVHSIQTDMKKLIVTFRNFTKAPKINKRIFFLQETTITGLVFVFVTFGTCVFKGFLYPTTFYTDACVVLVNIMPKIPFQRQ
jgi:hypothetical protein